MFQVSGNLKRLGTAALFSVAASAVQADLLTNPAYMTVPGNVYNPMYQAATADAQSKPESTLPQYNLMLRNSLQDKHLEGYARTCFESEKIEDVGVAEIAPGDARKVVGCMRLKNFEAVLAAKGPKDIGRHDYVSVLGRNVSASEAFDLVKVCTEQGKVSSPSEVQACAKENVVTTVPSGMLILSTVVLAGVAGFVCRRKSAPAPE